VNDWQLRRMCRRRLADLKLQSPLKLEQLCAEVSNVRGIPITLVAIRTHPRGPHGYWVTTSDRNYILFERDTSPLHQQHIIAHELGHVVSEHTGTAVSDDELYELLMPDIGTSLIRRVLGRSAYTSEQEREAEILASLLLSFGGWPEAPPPRPLNAELVEAVDEIEAAFQPRWRSPFR
jgi:hypothetical protein